MEFLPLAPISRRTSLEATLGAVFASCQLSAPALSAEGWISLFDGLSLNGWRASGNAESTSNGSWSVRDGQIFANGPASHLFYIGKESDPSSAQFRNFELELEALAQPGANSGVY